jgi:hypothetical protein
MLTQRASTPATLTQTSAHASAANSRPSTAHRQATRSELGPSSPTACCLRDRGVSMLRSGGPKPRVPGTKHPTASARSSLHPTNHRKWPDRPNPPLAALIPTRIRNPMGAELSVPRNEACSRSVPQPQPRSRKRAPTRAQHDQRNCADDRFSNRRAMINNWICCVPSKISRIFESRAHFSISSVSP